MTLKQLASISTLILLSPFVANSAVWPITEPDCLAANIYHEARGESLAGQYMVAYVTMNRVNSHRYPDTICEVVKQNAQFSWYNYKVSKYPTESDAWKRACNIATQFLLKLPMSQTDLSEGALYYHTRNIQPSWVIHKELIGRVGSHLFYR
jgi:N-acetylmuramoyl-L-alanine amidase